MKYIVRNSGVAPGDLSIELTDRDCMDNEVATRIVLGELHSAGGKIHMDDFGTGNSSLSYLQRSAFDTLKIDRAFVHGLGSEDQSRTMIETIVGLGRMLDINVVAEGVESQRQHDELLLLECPEAQGYWFSIAVPASEATELIRHSQGSGD